MAPAKQRSPEAWGQRLLRSSKGWEGGKNSVQASNAKYLHLQNKPKGAKRTCLGWKEMFCKTEALEEMAILRHLAVNRLSKGNLKSFRGRSMEVHLGGGGGGKKPSCVSSNRRGIGNRQKRRH